MFRLKIDTHHNTVSVEAPAQPAFCHQFTRRWEAAFLAALVDEGNCSGALSAQALQARLASLGQSKPLNRAQLQRLLDSLDAFFSDLPTLKAAVHTPPRKRTVGPWRLDHQGALSCQVDSQGAPMPRPHVCLIPTNDLDALHLLLGKLLVADALALDGHYQSALQTLITLDTTPLSTETLCLVTLRMAQWQRHVGDFKAARASAQAVLALSPALAPALAHHAQFFLQRTDYDESPAQNWAALWERTSAVPAAGHTKGPDARTLCEWHNLRALLARRCMAQISQQRGGETPEQGVDELHQLALRHLQAAIYLALWANDWTTLQAYVANFAFHLQTCLALPGQTAVTHHQVLRWYRLTMAYEDKLDVGRDSAWDYLFFAEFWLDHEARLQPGTFPDPLAHHLDTCSPDQEGFYLRAVQRLRQCGDARQVAIAHSLYLRFAQTHLAGKQRALVIESQTQQLQQLLASQTTGHLLQTLTAEGYAAHWPPGLAAGPKGSRGTASLRG